MIVKLRTENHLECLSLKGGCTGSSESTHVKIPHCWKSHALAHYRYLPVNISMDPIPPPPPPPPLPLHQVEQLPVVSGE